MRKWVSGILGAALLILFAASCAPRYFCSNCGKICTGTGYRDMTGTHVFCMECAVHYYSPLLPQENKWKARECPME